MNLRLASFAILYASLLACSGGSPEVGSHVEAVTESREPEAIVWSMGRHASSTTVDGAGNELSAGDGLRIALGANVFHISFDRRDGTLTCPDGSTGGYESYGVALVSDEATTSTLVQTPVPAVPSPGDMRVFEHAATVDASVGPYVFGSERVRATSCSGESTFRKTTFVWDMETSTMVDPAMLQLPEATYDAARMQLGGADGAGGEDISVVELEARFGHRGALILRARFERGDQSAWIEGSESVDELPEILKPHALPPRAVQEYLAHTPSRTAMMRGWSAIRQER